MTSAEQVFAGLTGRWALDRSIEPGIGTVVGTAVFTPDGPGRLLYREDVELRLAGGHVGPAFREYVYVLEAGRVRVLLVNGTTMHTLALDGAGAATDVHDCVADQYRGTYRFAEGAFTVDMLVTGPAKDYRTHTRYTRT